jgi:hypothetical protein
MDDISQAHLTVSLPKEILNGCCLLTLKKWLRINCTSSNHTGAITEQGKRVKSRVGQPHFGM